MNAYYGVLLALGAFLLGSCPFSVWMGRWRLHQDIRQYGDGNPGATNVFRAGGRTVGSVALVADILKGVPFVALAGWYYGLPGPMILGVALAAVLGHAFSPFLRFRGGKAIAVTFGVMLALPQYGILAVFTVLTVLGFLLVRPHGWAVTLAAAASVACLVLIGAGAWESLFMASVLMVFVAKHSGELRALPGVNGRLLWWLHVRGRET